MDKTVRFFIDDDHQNFLQVEYTAEWGWTAGAGDRLYIEVCGISLNGAMPIRLNDVKEHAPEWWAGINEQIIKETQKWEQQMMAA